MVIVGGGTDGLVCALALKAKMPGLEMRVIRLSDGGPPAIPEGCTIALTHFLHGFLRVDMRPFVQAARPSWTLGTRFEWGPRPHFYCPFGSQLDQRIPGLPRNVAFYSDDLDDSSPAAALMGQDKVFGRNQQGQPAWHWDFGYHLLPDSFLASLQALASSINIEIHDDQVLKVNEDDSGISSLTLASGQNETADLYVDCSGQRSLLLGQTLHEPFVSYKSSLPCDRLLIGRWERAGEPIHPYSTCETLEAGWTGQIEHLQAISRQYVYCSDFISDEQAQTELRAKAPKVGDLQTIKFASGRYERAWVKNVVAMGDACAYVEPLHATRLGTVAARGQLLGEVLLEAGGNASPAHVKLYNRHHARIWDSVRHFLAIHYKYNSRLQTPFWKQCRASTDLSGIEHVLEYYRQCGPGSLWGPMLLDPLDVFGIGGYLTVLLGLKAPTRVVYKPTTQEREIWDAERRKYRAYAAQGFTVAEALAAIPPPAPARAAGT